MSTGWRRASVLLWVLLAGVSHCAIPRPVLAQQSGRLVYIGIGGPTQEALRKALFQPFQADTGIQVVEETGLSQERIQAEVQSGRPAIDLLTTSTNTFITLQANNLLAPIDYKYFDPADLQSMPESARLKFAVNSVYVGLVMAFSTAAFPDGKPQPQSWADFWDVKTFPGKRTLPYCDVLEGGWPLPEAALLADGVPRDKLYPLDIPRAVKKLTEVAPHIVWWRNTSQPGQYLLSQEAVMSMDSSGRNNALIDKGAPIKIVWNQARVEGDKWLVLRGAPNHDNVMRFLAFAARPRVQAELARLIGYAPSNPRAYEFLDKAAAVKLPTFPENMKQAVLKDGDWWVANRPKWLEACMNAILR
jgi:putative spermidine/putrescine transport system substrate-binding protein